MTTSVVLRIALMVLEDELSGSIPGRVNLETNFSILGFGLSVLCGAPELIVLLCYL